MAIRAEPTGGRDFGPLGSLLGLLLALGLGVGLGALAFWDGRMGWSWQPRLLGPDPPFINDVPFLGTIAVGGLITLAALFLNWVRACGSWDRPVLGLLVFALFADAVPAVYQIALVLVFLILADHALRRGDLPLVITPLVLPVGLVLISYATTFLVTRSPAPDAVDFVFRASFLLMVPVLPLLLRTPRHLELLLHFVILSALLSALVAFGQLGLSFLTGKVISFAEPAFNRMAVGEMVFPRCTGLMDHPNHASNTLGTVAVLVLYLATGSRALVSRRRRLAYLATFVVLSLAVLITFSRSGWLALGCATLLVPLIRWPRFGFGYLLGLGLLAGVGWSSGLLPAALEFVRDLNASSADFRWHIDRIALQAFQQHPAIGVGVEGLLRYFNPYHLQVHNTYLQAFAEMGLFGVGAFLFLIGWMGWRISRAFRAARDPVRREWLIGLLLASAVLLVQNAVVMFLWIKFLWFWIGLIEAAVLVCLVPARDDDPDQVAFLPAVPDGS